MLWWREVLRKLLEKNKLGLVDMTVIYRFFLFRAGKWPMKAELTENTWIVCDNSQAKNIIQIRTVMILLAGDLENL